MKTITHTLHAVAVLGLAALVPGARLVAQEPAPEPAGLKIVLLRPLIRFQDVRGDAPAVKAAASDYERVVVDAAKRGVGAKTALLDVDKLEPPVVEACGRLDALASRLARGDVDEDAVANLAQLAALDERYAVLVQFFRLKTGPGVSWNSWTGAITSSTASTLIQAALISGKTGKVIWKGERLVRNKALRPESADLNKALTLVYRDFDTK